MKEIRIGNHLVGDQYPPFIIAEMSGNHNQSLDRAMELVEAAAKTGVHALKLQTATPDGLTLNIKSPDFLIDDPDSPWFGRNLYELYQQAVTPREFHKPIFERCNELGLTVFSSPFELGAVDFLEELNVPCYKIASFELVDIPLIRKVAATGKPIIMSTGMATVADIHNAVDAAKKVGNENIILLKCTSSYPATALDANISTIPHMRDMFGLQVGLSDHTLGIGVPCAAAAIGATVIEKHFTLNRDEGGVDSSFSLEPDEFALLVRESKQSWESVGHVIYGGAEVEKKSLKFRRSLYVAKDITKGEVLTAENLRIVRPGYGLLPKNIDILLGMKVNRDIRAGTAMKWEYIG
ncbi:N-acetylneuraminate synthase [Pseudidiomarina salinarum]|uniref:N-acetylneuraminate synthase n=1 Tax=Pseudidiomarina salinarum TaxID=435908 RepID=A0A094JFQ7_9GAMM|nr:pseudaminic acid synthase [Pseudidiomarina salinarum]KFZ31361.1 N-acetylneuraminate synthase [Pseudidiomarina salinarum]RUO70880.1 pseudaminic acid synthase [Pseudidiomarina salinarum]